MKARRRRIPGTIALYARPTPSQPGVWNHRGFAHRDRQNLIRLPDNACQLRRARRLRLPGSRDDCIILPGHRFREVKPGGRTVNLILTIPTN